MQDRARVERRFSEASSHGIRVEQGAVSTAELLQHLHGRGPAIALVDAGYLACDFCKRNKGKAGLKSLSLSSLVKGARASRR